MAAESRKRISISGTLSLGAATQRHIRAQRTRPKCRRCCTALDGHLFLSRLLILPSQQSRDLEVIEKAERYRRYGLLLRKSENICQRSVAGRALSAAAEYIFRYQLFIPYALTILPGISWITPTNSDLLICRK